MHLLILINCIITIITHTQAAPRPDQLATICPKSNASSLLLPGTTSSVAIPLPSTDECAPGGVCDCSRIPDKNSDEYFQCVTNPNCEPCWVNRPTTSTTSASSSLKIPAANATSISVNNYRTMSPGTYTITTNGTVLNIVVTQEIVTPSSSTQILVTMTETVVITVSPSEGSAKASPASTGTASKPSSTATLDDDCYGRCNCSKVKDKDSMEFFECLTNPDCEKCTSTNTAAWATKTSYSGTISTSSASGNATTSSSGPPTDACPQFCDCSGIEDKESEAYFQCITNPVCERCKRNR